jgi:hypothetical protein
VLIVCSKFDFAHNGTKKKRMVFRENLRRGNIHKPSVHSGVISRGYLCAQAIASERQSQVKMSNTSESIDMTSQITREIAGGCAAAL